MTAFAFLFVGFLVGLVMSRLIFEAWRRKRDPYWRVNS